MAAWTNGLDARIRKLTSRLCSPAGLDQRERLSLEALRLILHTAQIAHLGWLPRTKRRQTVRAKLLLALSVENERGSIGRGMTLDVGMGGVGALVNRAVPVGARLYVTFTLPDYSAKVLVGVETMWC